MKQQKNLSRVRMKKIAKSRSEHKFAKAILITGGPGSSVGIATELRAEKVRGSNPGGGENLRTCPDRAWGPHGFLYNGYRVFPGGKVRQGRAADSLLVPRSWKSRAIPLPTLWATLGL
jgi:hypothetical protein